MSATLTARQIGEKALQLIGDYSPNDTGADPENLARALEWLDIEVSHLAGTEQMDWLIEDSVTFTLTADEASRTVADALSGVTFDLQFIVAAQLVDSNGNETPIEIVPVTQYEAIDDKDQSGRTCKIYIDRQASAPVMYFWPVVSTSGYSVRMTLVDFAPTLTDPHSDVATKLRPAWNKWAVNQLAATIGTGPVRALPDNRIRTFLAIAEEGRLKLIDREDRQHDTRPPVMEAWGDYL